VSPPLIPPSLNTSTEIAKVKLTKLIRRGLVAYSLEVVLESKWAREIALAEISSFPL
jgi:hypothetical protein